MEKAEGRAEIEQKVQVIATYLKEQFPDCMAERPKAPDKLDYIFERRPI